MEIPGISSGTSEDGRRKEERRTGARDSSERRLGDRRYDTLARTVVEVGEEIPVSLVGKLLRSLAKRGLIGPLVMFVTGCVALAAYTATRGFVAGSEIILAIFIHELGHAVAAEMRGLRWHWWWFIPLLGAVMRLPEIKSRSDEAFVAIGGPFLGAVSALVAFLLWRFAPLSEAWQHYAYEFALIATIINLFNLTALAPLDGGRIIRAASDHLQWLGLVFLALVSRFIGEISLFLVWIFVVLEQFLEHPIWRFFAALGLLLAMGAMIFLERWQLEWLGLVLLVLVSWFFCEISLFLVWVLVALEQFFKYPLRRLIGAIGLFLATGAVLFLGREKLVLETGVFFAFGVTLVISAHPYSAPPATEALPELPLKERLAWFAAWGTLVFALSSMGYALLTL